MGMDVYGLAPKINTTRFKDKLNKLVEEDLKGESIYSDNVDQSLKTVYWDLQDEDRKANPGIYFRNNVWYWHPLWNLVALVAGHILTDKDIKEGHFNSCYQITKDKAEKIAVLLEKSIKDKTAHNFMKQCEKDERSFSIENVEEFILFCKESGGFEIG